MVHTTVIPDIHADPNRLEASLFMAQDDRIAFLGDFIDGHRQSEHDDHGVLTRVHELVETGRAVAVMGNHELNAILFHRTDRDGRPLRAHDEKNRKQHETFIDSFGIGTVEAYRWTEWFLTLPLWLDLGGLRLVHACWDADAIEKIAERRPDGRLHPMDLQEVAGKATEFAQAVERLTSGPELPLPNHYSFTDSKEIQRTEVRVAWWLEPGQTWQNAALSVPDPSSLPEGIVPSSAGVPFYPENAPPVLAGHYKMAGVPALATPQASSLDYPTSPCVYCWQGEAKLMPTNLKRISFDNGSPQK